MRNLVKGVAKEVSGSSSDEADGFCSRTLQGCGRSILPECSRNTELCSSLWKSAHHFGSLFQSRLRILMFLAHNHTVLNGIGVSTIPVL